MTKGKVRADKISRSDDTDNNSAYNLREKTNQTTPNSSNKWTRRKRRSDLGLVLSNARRWERLAAYALPSHLLIYIAARKIFTPFSSAQAHCYQ